VKKKYKKERKTEAKKDGCQEERVTKKVKENEKNKFQEGKIQCLL
jgi:hypothetical protein